MRAAFDTNILVDYLNGVAAARAELERFDERLISIVTWMDVMVGVAEDDEPVVDAFLRSFHVAAVDPVIAREAVRLRRAVGVRVPYRVKGD